MTRQFNSSEELIADIRQGKMVILVDDEDRENEGDIVVAADHITPEKVNFMARYARGLICLSLTKRHCDQLKLPLMVQNESNHSPNKTAFTVSVEAAQGVSTGISAEDRYKTIKACAAPQAQPSDIIVPGHIFPIRAQEGGVLKRAGHTEGSVDLAQMAGLNPAAVICEVMKDDGTMARVDDLFEFAERHSMKVGTIADLIRYRLQTETLIEECTAASQLSMAEGVRTRVFRSLIDGTEHIVLQKGEFQDDEPALVRVQSEDMMNDLLASLGSRAESKLARALDRIEKHGSGVLLYLRKPPFQRGSEPPMDEKDYGIGAQILRHLGLGKIRLITDNPIRRGALKGYNLEIVETIPFS